MPQTVLLEEIGVAHTFPASEIVLAQVLVDAHMKTQRGTDRLRGVVGALQVAAVERDGAVVALAHELRQALGLPEPVLAERRVGGTLPHAMDIGRGFAVSDEHQDGSSLHAQNSIPTSPDSGDLTSADRGADRLDRSSKAPRT
jgi:hypothetical protein